MWKAITYVNSGITLAALFVLAGLSAYRSRNARIIKEFAQVPQKDRAGLVKDALSSFSVDTYQLSEKQKFSLLMARLRDRDRNLRRIAVVVVILACLAAGVALFALWRLPPQSHGEDTLNLQTPTAASGAPGQSDVMKMTPVASPVRASTEPSVSNSAPGRSSPSQSESPPNSTVPDSDQKNLIAVLRQADNLVKVNTSSADLQALELYSQVMSKLSGRTRAQLDQSVLKKAVSADRSGNIREAVESYRSLFSDYLR